MIKKLSVIILTVSFILTISFVFSLTSCENPTDTEAVISSRTAAVVETTQKDFNETSDETASSDTAADDLDPAIVAASDSIQEKLNLIETNYSTAFRNKIGSIPDEGYKEAILNDNAAIEAINFFNNYGYSDLLLDKKIALQEFGFIKLYDILKSYDKNTIDDYIKNVTDPRNDNAIALIVSNNVEDIATGFSAFIADSFNLPYFIISYKDGSVIDAATNLTLDQNDDDWKTKGIYPYLSPYMEELDYAKSHGDTENIKIDKTKEKILDYFKELLKQNKYIYFFSNGHEDSSSYLLLYSSKKTEKISALELYEAITTAAQENAQENIIFKRIGNNCGDGFDIKLDSYFAGAAAEAVTGEEISISYSLLSSSKDKKNMSPNILDAIAFSMNYSKADPVIMEELKRLGRGDGKTGTYKFNKRTIDFFETDIPGYQMEFDSDGPADFDPELRTNVNDRSLFYIRLNYFEISN